MVRDSYAWRFDLIAGFSLSLVCRPTVSAVGLLISAELDNGGEPGPHLKTALPVYALAAIEGELRETGTPPVIIQVHDSLNRLTGATYSTGESFAYQYDAVGNRTAMTTTSPLDETTVTTYTYDAANRLTSVQQPASSIQYTWDDRGNLVSDGTFTYAYNGAGRMVACLGTNRLAESITATLVYTYNAQGLRVAQSVDGTVTTFAWDWASGLPEMLAQSPNPQSPNHQSLYLVGHDTLARWDGSEWAYHLPDALGSVRQVADGAGVVVSSREWTPYGVEVGTPRAGLGYAGEWWDAAVGLQYLRARWYDGQVGRFTRADPMTSILNRNGGDNAYVYVSQNPINSVDPSGYFSDNAIVYSLGAYSFEEVIQMFKGDDKDPPFVGGRWGLLKLLQEAENGDTLSWLSVAEFGSSKRVPVGQLYSPGCTIMVANMPLRPWLRSFFDPQHAETRHPVLPRDYLQAYYLNGQPFRDGGNGRSGLPDYASLVLNVDVYAPEGWAGAGIGTQVVYTVDRYGNAYLTILSIGVGVGVSPFSWGYTEGCVFRWNGDDSIVSERELGDLISGISSGITFNAAVLQYSGEINWDHTWNDCVMVAMGYVIGQAGINLDLFVPTFRLSKKWSLNPQGWIWVEGLPRYEEHVFPGERVSSPEAVSQCRTS